MRFIGNMTNYSEWLFLFSEHIFYIKTFYYLNDASEYIDEWKLTYNGGSLPIFCYICPHLFLFIFFLSLLLFRLNHHYRFQSVIRFNAIIFIIYVFNCLYRNCVVSIYWNMWVLKLQIRFSKIMIIFFYRNSGYRKGGGFGWRPRLSVGMNP